MSFASRSLSFEKIQKSNWKHLIYKKNDDIYVNEKIIGRKNELKVVYGKLQKAMVCMKRSKEI